MYVPCSNKTTDLLNPADLSLVTNLETNNEKFILAYEIEDKYILMVCASGHSFLFSLSDFTRLKYKKLKETPMSYL